MEQTGHRAAYICNLIPFKCILEKKTISLIEHIRPGGQTATVMNTTLWENYSVLYPAVVGDEKGSGPTHRNNRERGRERERGEAQVEGKRSERAFPKTHNPVNRTRGADKL